MFTVCPKCALILAVTAADLRVGQGYVRCGRCASVFNALAGLHEESPPAGDRRPATPSAPPPPLMMEIPAAATDEPPSDTMEFALGSADLAQIFIAPEIAEGETASGTFESIVLEGDMAPEAGDEPVDAPDRQLIEADEELEIIARAARDAIADPGSGTMQFEALQDASPPPSNSDEFYTRAEDIDAYETEEPQSRAALWYGVAAAALGGLLLAQIVHHYRNDLVTSPFLHGPLSTIYAAMGAPLAPHWEPAAIDVRQLGAIAEADASGQLVVRASIRNEAPRAQPMPLLRLTLQDRFGKRVASRDLTPTEYLGERARARGFLAAGQRVDAEIAVVDPGRNAVGFELDACLPNGTGGVACAGDTRVSR